MRRQRVVVVGMGTGNRARLGRQQRFFHFRCFARLLVHDPAAVYRGVHGRPDQSKTSVTKSIRSFFQSQSVAPNICSENFSVTSLSSRAASQRLCWHGSCSKFVHKDGVVVVPGIRVVPYIRHFLVFVVISHFTLAAFYFVVGALTRSAKIVYGLGVSFYPLLMTYHIVFLKSLAAQGGETISILW